MSETIALSSYLVGLSYKRLAPEVVVKAKRCLLDYIGYTAYGCEGPPAPAADGKGGSGA